MKVFISKGAGINKLIAKIKINLKTGKVARGQFNESRFLNIENAKSKYWKKEKPSEFHAEVIFIFIFPQRKIRRALKEKK